MKSTLFFLLLTLSFNPLWSQNTPMLNEKDSASYAAGLNEGQRMEEMLMQAGADTILNKQLFLEGFADFMLHKPKMDAEATQKVLMSFFGKLQEELIKEQEKQEEEYKKQFAANKEKSIAFLTENKAKKDIITTESGLQYRIDKKGKGKKIKIGDKISVHYTGTFIDGTKFDTSREEGAQPFEFELKQDGLIPGWIEALQLMSKGSVYTIYLPWELGYGENGSNPTIPPYSVLVFEMEIMDHIPAK